MNASKTTSRRRTIRVKSSKRSGRGLSRPVKKQVAKIAKGVMSRAIETQYVSDNQELAYQAIYGDTVPSGGIPQVYACLPQTSQTDEPSSSGRRGLKIQPTKLRTDLRFIFADENLINVGGTATRVDAAAWDVTVHIWYGYVKRYKIMSDVLANAGFVATNLLEVDGTTLQRFSGRLEDETFELNKEFVAMKHKKFRMFKNAGLPNVLDTVIPAQNFPVQNAHRVSLTWKPLKTLSYADESATYPENYAPVMIVGYCHNDGTQAANVSNGGPTTIIQQVPAIQMLQVNKLWFKDA